MNIRAFPKIFHIGEGYIEKLFEGEVEITEKIDGSQLNFGKIEGELYIRSKGAQIFPETVPGMFKGGVEHILEVKDRIPDNTVFYGECLEKPHHNVLKYERIPKNHIALFGVSDEHYNFIKDYEKLKEYADLLDIDVVPLLYEGEIKTIKELEKFLDFDSYLGGTKVEGIVVKNYNQPFLLGGQPIPVMMGKYVREDFKETLKKEWNSKKTSKGRWEEYKESFRTEARWNKAIQHLAEKGELEYAPRDIGKLIKEIQNDITEEEKENIKEFLWNEFGQELLRSSTRNFPEYYKRYLLARAFELKQTI